MMSSRGFIQTGILAAVFFLAGCQNVQVDSEPVGYLGSSRFVVDDTSCMRLMGKGILLPLDHYYAGACYEKGVGVPLSPAKAEEFYITAARWGVPEAVQALERLGKPVPAPDLLRQQQETGEQINREHERVRQNQLEQERNRAIRDAYWLNSPCYGHSCWRHHRYRCGHLWCY